jgi:serine/threonine protein kinase
MVRCSYCFRDRGGAAVCPHCGEDESEAPRSSLALAPGTWLHEQYRVGRVLGSGGFGVTYLAWDERLETRVAVKEYFPRAHAARGGTGATLVPHSGGDRPLFAYGLEQFLGEARTLARFDHPNIVGVRTYFEANGTGYLVMDYYDGQSLSGYLDGQPGGKLPERRAIQILMPVLDGLRAVHAEGVLHRDLKPANVYLTSEGRVILLDFGAARAAVGERSQSLSEIYTAGYAPFEQYSRRGQQGPWTDVYACAGTLYRMVTGQAPLDAPERAMGAPLVAAHELEPTVSDRLSRALERGLALRPVDRPQSAQAFQRLLMAEEPVEHKPTVTVEERTEPPTRPPSSSSPEVGAAAHRIAGGPRAGSRRLAWISGAGVAAAALIWLIVRAVAAPSAASKAPSRAVSVPIADQAIAEADAVDSAAASTDSLEAARADCAEGEARPCWLAGRAYEHGGADVRPNLRLAREYYGKACKLGEADGCRDAERLRPAAPPPRKPPPSRAPDAPSTRSLSPVEQAELDCVQGRWDQCFVAGKAHEYGEGTDRNYAKALDLLSRGCRGGNGFSCVNLGAMYQLGWGTAEDHRQAGLLYARGCDRGAALGCANLGRFYESGDGGVARNLPYAANAYAKACQLGEARACQDLDRLRRATGR